MSNEQLPWGDWGYGGNKSTLLDLNPYFLILGLILTFNLTGQFAN
jgi:hypothetical protein